MATQSIIIHDDALRKRAIDLLARLDLSKPWRLTVAPYRKGRTLSQNSLYWAWVNKVVALVASHTGIDADEIHVFFKTKFLPARIVEIAGETAEYRTTTKLTTKEMSEYMFRIDAFCASTLGLMLPTPEQVQER